MIDGLIDRLKQFCEDETYTYFRDIFDYNFNGYVVEVFETKFLFLDNKLGNIYVSFSNVKLLTYSDREKGE